MLVFLQSSPAVNKCCFEECFRRCLCEVFGRSRSQLVTHGGGVGYKRGGSAVCVKNLVCGKGRRAACHYVYTRQIIKDKWMCDYTLLYVVWLD